MMTETLVLSIHDLQALPTAKRIIQQGGLIAFPTDTIYGVAGDVLNPRAIEKIFAAKERPDQKALPVLIGDFNQLTSLILHLDLHLEKIAAAFWPGPLTLVLLKNPQLPPELSPYPTIGIRMPNLPFTLNLLQETGPLATTSANLSGGPNPVKAADVLSQLGGRIDLLLDGGPTPGPTASTVADLTQPEIHILRAGPISLSDLQAVLNGE